MISDIFNGIIGVILLLFVLEIFFGWSPIRRHSDK